ncbi:hypothetical protein [Acinetobacter chinensis]|uniref:hypothetical protein n=1 Tax=Acinetobacter chinensis TaxID=2004650 RepID=UPI002934A7A1|nr:hypothetical protein [Acinetobacter chinensis]WOE40065.1 hypothetical protein QSG87_09075 [Acinetobacter chinensis]
MALQFYMTEVGKNAAMDAENQGVTLLLDQIAVGAAKYNAANAKGSTSLKAELARYPLNGGSVEPESHTLRLVSNIESTITADIFEIALYTKSGVLFALASTLGDDPILRLANDIVSLVTFGFVIVDIDLSNVQISMDSNTPVAVQLMNQHLAHSDPHPQYALLKAVLEKFKAHSDDKNPHSQYATDSDLSEAAAYFASLLEVHKRGSNPHPQYLLNSTFGVDLEMKANLNTKRIAANRVLGWDGANGDYDYFSGTISWNRVGAGSISFKPYRAYGQFLLYLRVSTAVECNAVVTVFDGAGTEIQKKQVWYYFGDWATIDKYHVMEIPKGGHAVVDWYTRAGNSKKADFLCGIYVEDRVKPFIPIGYSSVVDNTNTSGTEVSKDTDDYSVFPEFSWFYFDDTQKKYLELNKMSTFDTPVSRVPHYHRTKFTGLLDKQICIVAEVATQSIELPESDYKAVATQILFGETDAAGNIVVEVPFSMRNVETTNNETLVYTFAYYASEVAKNPADEFPSGHLDGLNRLFVRKI